jgi:hypothetical protein
MSFVIFYIYIPTSIFYISNSNVGVWKNIIQENISHIIHNDKYAGKLPQLRPMTNYKGDIIISKKNHLHHLRFYYILKQPFVLMQELV